jgi:hypothetical protein
MHNIYKSMQEMPCFPGFLLDGSSCQLSDRHIQKKYVLHMPVMQAQTRDLVLKGLEQHAPVGSLGCRITRRDFSVTLTFPVGSLKFIFWLLL